MAAISVTATVTDATGQATSATVVADIAAAGEVPGSAPVGATSYAYPADAVFVAKNGSDTGAGTLASPYLTIGKAVTVVAATGKTVVVRAGVYNEQLNMGTKNCTIQSYPLEAVWLDGSVRRTDWTKVAGQNQWTIPYTFKPDHSASYTYGSNAGGFTDAAYPLAAWPDNVFVDDVWLQIVSGTPTPGQFKVDQAANLLTIGTDPTGKVVTVANREYAILCGGSGRCNLKGIGVRRYATPLPTSATVFYAGSVGGSLLENVWIEDNNGQGLSMSSTDNTARHVTSIRNGANGAHSHKSTRAVFEWCDFSGNNVSHWSETPSVAGIKVTETRNIKILNCRVWDNVACNGIWLDTTDLDPIVAHNDVKSGPGSSVIANCRYAIILEADDAGIVAGNVIRGVWSYPAENFISSRIRWWNNQVDAGESYTFGFDQDNRRNTDTATNGRCPWVISGAEVCNNEVLNDSGDNEFSLYALDKSTGINADTFFAKIRGNAFRSDVAGVKVGWGGTANVLAATYNSVAAFEAAKGAYAANNQQLATGAAVDHTKAEPIPADIAAVLGVPAGTKLIGVP